MASEEKQLSSKIIYEGRVIKLRRDEVEIVENGVKTTREVAMHPGGCCCLVKTEDDKFLFVRQYRYPYNEFTIEVPAGKRDNGEDPLDTITRELQEEVGIKPKRLDFLGRVYPSPGFMNEVLYLYYTDDYEKSSLEQDFDESLDVLKLSIDEALAYIDEGKIVDAKTIIVLLKYCLKIKK